MTLPAQQFREIFHKAEYNESYIEPPLRKSPANGLCVEPTDQHALANRVAFLMNIRTRKKCVSAQVQSGLTILRNVHL